ncbi:hypothetical protein [Pedobacter cryoconitis]|uniref:hypothetical protein n=1 Tax=Pedobacter cryoconitis TaxID=188932 RepID=UPI001620EDAB|nr:hypothetical protein [Pedobacter cryoconitis]MBB5643986.1 hypothetical protein [Pedobacter cryoconitis]
MTLFDQKQRTLLGPARNNSNSYTYYNDSARKDVGVVRDLVESWFEKYPEEEKEEMRSRFKVTFDDTFYELYIFTLFTALGYKLTVHPEIPETDKKPDFKAEKGNEHFYIEVKYITMLSQNEKGQKRRENELLDGLNKIDATNFLLSLKEIIFKDQSQPSNKLIINHFNKLIGEIDPDAYTEQMEKLGFGSLPVLLYEDDKVRIRLTLLPKVAHKRGVQSRAIGSFPIITQIGNDSSDIKTALERKAGRYGKFNAPYIICVNKQSISLDLIELQESLYGSMASTWSTDPNNRDEKLELSGNGFFGSLKNKKATRVSGVYLTNANTANLASTADHAFRHNQFAEFPINLVITNSVKDILSIKENYPYD